MNYIHGTPAKKGHEADLVWEFIQNSLPSTPIGLSRTVFIEPNLCNSIPDIVLVFWDPSVTNKWPAARSFLKIIDFKLIQYLYQKESETEESLSKFFPKELPKSLDRLQKADAVVRVGPNWKLRPFEELFAVKKIISYEAKISTSTRVIEQAYLNSMFSSESYIITKSEYPRNYAINAAERLGIGLWSIASMQQIQLVGAKEYILPQSYQSWVLNDLAWEYSMRGINGYKC